MMIINLLIGLMPWFAALGMYFFMALDAYDFDKHARRIARLALLTPVYPIVVAVLIVYGFILGLRKTIQVAEIGPKKKKPDYDKIKILELEKELEDSKRDAEIANAEIKKLLEQPLDNSKVYVGRKKIGRNR